MPSLFRLVMYGVLGVAHGLRQMAGEAAGHVLRESEALQFQQMQSEGSLNEQQQQEQQQSLQQQQQQRGKQDSEFPLRPLVALVSAGRDAASLSLPSLERARQVRPSGRDGAELIWTRRSSSLTPEDDFYGAFAWTTEAREEPEATSERPQEVDSHWPFGFFRDVRPLALEVPDWIFKPLDLVRRSVHALGVERMAPVVALHAMAGDPGMRLEFKRLPLDEGFSRNEMHFFELLGWSGNIQASFGSIGIFGTTYMVVEKVDGTLEDMLATYPNVGGKLKMPYGKSLPILIDLLRGLVDLEAEHVVHCRLDEWHIAMKDGRPLIADLGSAVVVLEHAAQDLANSTHGWTSVADIVTRMPPEAISALPTGVANNVWAVGLLFAKLVLGFVPTHETLARVKVQGGARTVLEQTQHVVTAIRKHFFIEQIPAVAELPEDIRGLLLGMLEKHTERRWSARGALEQAILVAERRGITVPPERPQRRPKSPRSSEWI